MLVDVDAVQRGENDAVTREWINNQHLVCLGAGGVDTKAWTMSSRLVMAGSVAC